MSLYVFSAVFNKFRKSNRNFGISISRSQGVKLYVLYLKKELLFLLA